VNLADCSKQQQQNERTNVLLRLSARLQTHTIVLDKFAENLEYHPHVTHLMPS